MDTGNSRAEEETNDAEHPINWQTVVYGRRKKQEASRNLSSFLEAAAANPQLKQKKILSTLYIARRNLTI